MKICDFYLLFRLSTEIKVTILNSIKKKKLKRNNFETALEVETKLVMY